MRRLASGIIHPISGEQLFIAEIGSPYFIFSLQIWEIIPMTIVMVWAACAFIAWGIAK